MKCPKCGFVSYPGLAQCKKCGHSFLPGLHKGTSNSSSRLISLFSDSTVQGGQPSKPDSPVAPDVTPASASLIQPSDRVDGEGSSEALPESAPPPDSETTFADLDVGSTHETVPAPDVVRPWREELSQRVQNFRRRRARLRQHDRNLNLDFDFHASVDEENEAAADAVATQSSEAEPELDVMLEATADRDVEMPLDALPLERPGAEPGTVEPSTVEIVLESSLPPPGQASSPAALLISRAPLGRRLLAGIADTLILLAAAALFGIVFWQVGVRLTLRPFNLLVLAFIAAFFVLVYFGLFTALTSSTPGLLWMGLEVRNLEGDHPTPRQAIWRAFGYLVSIAGLMLGFIWALLDSEGLTWHDRMSHTFLAAAPRDSRL